MLEAREKISSHIGIVKHRWEERCYSCCSYYSIWLYHRKLHFAKPVCTHTFVSSFLKQNKKSRTTCLRIMNYFLLKSASRPKACMNIDYKNHNSKALCTFNSCSPNISTYYFMKLRMGLLFFSASCRRRHFSVSPHIVAYTDWVRWKFGFFWLFRNNAIWSQGTAIWFPQKGDNFKSFLFLTQTKHYCFINPANLIPT